MKLIYCTTYIILNNKPSLLIIFCFFQNMFGKLYRTVFKASCKFLHLHHREFNVWATYPPNSLPNRQPRRRILTGKKDVRLWRTPAFVNSTFFSLRKSSVKIPFFPINAKKCGLNFTGRKDTFLTAFSRPIGAHNIFGSGLYITHGKYFMYHEVPRSHTVIVIHVRSIYAPSEPAVCDIICLIHNAPVKRVFLAREKKFVSCIRWLVSFLGWDLAL